MNSCQPVFHGWIVWAPDLDQEGGCYQHGWLTPVSLPYSQSLAGLFGAGSPICTG